MGVNQFNSNDSDRPLCRFGPGGDFVYDWPPKPTQLPTAQPSPLNKVLGMIADIMGTAISAELMIESQMSPFITARSTAGQSDDERPTNSHLIREKELSAGDKSSRTNHTPPIAGPKGDSPLAKEPMLFGDDCGISRGPKRKPHYRIRAHRGPSRKRSAYRLEGQGTLFEINSPGQSAA